MTGAGTPASPGIRLGNAPCSWGIMGGFDLASPPTYRQVLEEIAGCGFAGTELGDWGFMPDNAGTLRRELDRHELAMIGAFTPVRLTERACHAGAISDALRAARLLAGVSGTISDSAPLVILAEAATPARQALAGRVGPEHIVAGDAWKALAAGAEAVAQRVRDETGLGVVFHPHCGTSVETAEETARFLEMTDAALIGLCYDTGHVAYGGDDPLAALRRFRDRIRLVHFKDYRAGTADRARAEMWDYHTSVAGGLFCELGRGTVDFGGITAYLVASGYGGWVVVEDELPPGSGVPRESAARDRAYLRGLGL